MGTVMLAWMLGTAALLVWVLVVCVLWHTDDVPLPAPVAPRATIRLLFVEQTARGFLIDGLLDIEGSPVGVPTTWLLEPPGSELFSSATLDLLERWSDDCGDVRMDLSKLHGARPSVALSRDDSLVRLPVIGLSPLTDHDRFAHP